ncbi:MAG TPA: TMEM175 family protein [Actinomycetes bacterium]|nr:TMEM175 family protein [Actinomycetes bacterium]
MSTLQLSRVGGVRWDSGAVVSPTIRYQREGPGLEFDRVTFFTDAVFAIAMTLLVVEVGVPEALDGADTDPGALLAELRDKVPLIAAFFLGCFVIGSYWAAHHRFVARLAVVDLRFVFLTVVYLSFIALLPFPTGLVGKYPAEPDFHRRVRRQHGRGQHDGGGAPLSRLAEQAAQPGNAAGRLPVDAHDVALSGGAVRPLPTGRLHRYLAGGARVGAVDPGAGVPQPAPTGIRGCLPVRAGADSAA